MLYPRGGFREQELRTAPWVKVFSTQPITPMDAAQCAAAPWYWAFSPFPFSLAAFPVIVFPYVFCLALIQPWSLTSRIF